MMMLNQISTYSGIIPLIIAIYCLRYLHKDMKILLAYFVVASIVDISNVILGKVFGTNIWLFNVFILIDYSFFIVVLSLWQNKESMKRLLPFSIPVFFVIWIVTQILKGTISELNEPARSIEAMIFTLVASFTLNQISNKSSDQSLLKNYKFIVVCAILFYFAGNTFLFALMGADPQILDRGWGLHSIVNIIANMIFAWGFYNTRT